MLDFITLYGETYIKMVVVAHLGLGLHSSQEDPAREVHCLCHLVNPRATLTTTSNPTPNLKPPQPTSRQWSLLPPPWYIPPVIPTRTPTPPLTPTPTSPVPPSRHTPRFEPLLGRRSSPHQSTLTTTAHTRPAPRFDHLISPHLLTLFLALDFDRPWRSPPTLLSLDLLALLDTFQA